MTTPRETEKLNGELEIDYQRNKVKFHPNALCESAFSLPLSPLDVDTVRSLTQISRRLETQSQSPDSSYSFGRVVPPLEPSSRKTWFALRPERTESWLQSYRGSGL